jgi:voltage-gated sodium channel
MEWAMQRDRLAAWLESAGVRNTIIAVILFNAVLLGLETFPAIMAVWGPVILTLDRICLGIFAVEIALKLYALGLRFFRSGWNVFDFVIVGVALLPGAQTLSVLRAMRILRLLRVISVTPSLRRVVEGLLRSLPGMGSVFLLMGIIFYIGAVMATKLFGASFPAQFGTLWGSGFTLFQVMTLEGWADGVVRPVMAVYPYAWAFFLPFILVTTFAVVNLLVGLIVNSMQDAHDAADKADEAAYRDAMLARLAAIEARLAQMSGPGDQNR